MGVFLRGKDSQDVFVLVHRFAEVAALLFVPPLRVRITELALERGGLEVAPVLVLSYMLDYHTCQKVRLS